MRIEVTAADIAAANEWAAKRDADIAREGLNWRGHLTDEGSLAKNCPVARAARRVLGDRFVDVGPLLALRGDGVLLVTIELEPGIVERMYAWDDGNGMEPFSVEVEVPYG